MPQSHGQGGLLQVFGASGPVEGRRAGRAHRQEHHEDKTAVW